MTGQDIRTIRQAHGLSQSTLADTLGYTQQYIALLESGRRPVQGRFEKLLKRMLSPLKKPVDITTT